MSLCISVISHARWKRHLYPKDLQPGQPVVCKRCLQPAFVKPNALDRVINKAAKDLGYTPVVFPEQVEIAKEILGME
jgi:hypothetical protein